MAKAHVLCQSTESHRWHSFLVLIIPAVRLGQHPILLRRKNPPAPSPTAFRSTSPRGDIEYGSQPQPYRAHQSLPSFDLVRSEPHRWILWHPSLHLLIGEPWQSGGHPGHASRPRNRWPHPEAKKPSRQAIATSTASTFHHIRPMPPDCQDLY